MECEHPTSLEFGLLFDEGIGAVAEEERRGEEESHTFIYLRILRRLCALENSGHRKVLDVVRTTTRALRPADREVRRQVLGRVEQELLMQGHQASLCNSKGSDAAGLLSFRHSFVRVDDDFTGEILLIEPQLRAEFEIVRPTSQYQRLLDAVPQEFVGTAFQLAAIVEFMSERMGESFRRGGMSPPPWRQARSMLSKWELRSLVHISKLGSASETPKDVATPPSACLPRHTREKHRSDYPKGKAQELKGSSTTTFNTAGLLRKAVARSLRGCEGKVKGGCAFLSTGTVRCQ